MHYVALAPLICIENKTFAQITVQSFDLRMKTLYAALFYVNPV